MSTSFGDVLTKIRQESKNSVELGRKFEELTLNFLQEDKVYSSRFKNVSLWSNWKHRDGHDAGIDLMAEEQNGDWCAIQCKCYDENGKLSYPMVTTFVGKAASLSKKHRKIVNLVLVYTGDDFTSHTEKILDDAGCHTIFKNELEASHIDWSKYPKIKAKAPKPLRPHQKNAVSDVLKKLPHNDRGQLIMACGTGKTLTALRIAEKWAGVGKLILYLVPSIALINQTMREWSENAILKHTYIGVCSDTTVGVNTKDDEEVSISELSIPPTTDAKQLKNQLKCLPKNTMNVIFSTYHSIDVVSKSLNGKLVEIALCDEAHRTTGLEKESYFTKIHDDSNINAKKRIYMTATPKMYTDAAKERAKKRYGKEPNSMDDEEKFGARFHTYSFPQAVDDGLLADFIIRVPVISKDDLLRYQQESIDKIENGGGIDERVLLAAVWHGLNHAGVDVHDIRKGVLQKVIAFAGSIKGSQTFAGPYNGEGSTSDEQRYSKKTKKRETEDIPNRSFVNTVRQYEEKSGERTGNTVVVRHIDGKQRSHVRSEKLKWLEESTKNPKECRILSNARCLSEGVDIPSLDAVIFLQPRKSKTDVIQAVGRVMRKPPGKKYGYVILPVLVPGGSTPEEILADSKPWTAVWQVLNALRSHDPNFSQKINRLQLYKSNSTFTPHDLPVEIIYMGSLTDNTLVPALTHKITTEMVQHCGDREYYENKARELGEKAKCIRHIIVDQYNNNNTKIVNVVDNLCEGLQIIINDSINVNQTIDALAQHHALAQVFDVLFPKEFRSANPIAKILDNAIENIGMGSELKQFDSFYDTVKKEIKNFERKNSKQNYIKKIYGNFMLGFDKKKSEAHGIVYTPDEIIDFIIHSIEYVLRNEFKTGFNKNNVKIFDPFTGTGAFITRLLESGTIAPHRIKSKLENDIWASEISLLAYYVASINIEYVTKQITKSTTRTPYNNLNYTDTFNHHPRYRLDKIYRRRVVSLDGDMAKLHDSIQKSNWAHIHIIMSNPPYKAGQSKFDEDNANISYPELDKRIADTYLERTTTHNKRQLYDLYIRAIRWASDRIGNSGVIGFVTNGSFIKSDIGSGIRACLEEEFDYVWCYDLRGNQRTQGEESLREGGKIFGSGSRAPVSITILVKKPKKAKCVIRYHDIGDYLTRDEKLDIIRNNKSIDNMKWEHITPDKHNDWVEHRDNSFSKYMPIGSSDGKKGKSVNVVFTVYSLGIITGRDDWAYNYSKNNVSSNMKKHIEYCNSQNLKKIDVKLIDKTKARWSITLTSRLLKKKPKFDESNIRAAVYRPFFKQYLYFDHTYNENHYQVPKLFPNSSIKNLSIIIPSKLKGAYSVYVSELTPDAHIIGINQVFSFYYFDNDGAHENISNSTLKLYQTHYKNKKITKMNIFEYVYGILHHGGYRKKFRNNLSKELPHIPMAPSFTKFCEIGRKLINLHLNYDDESHTKHGIDKLGKPKFVPKKFTKIAFGANNNKTSICEGKTIVFDNLPKIKYKVGGRTPIEWLVYKYNRNVNSESSIVNNPLEFMTGEEIINFVYKLVYVSLESDRLIESLPKEFEPKIWKPEKIGLDKFSPETIIG